MVDTKSGTVLVTPKPPIGGTRRAHGTEPHLPIEIMVLLLEQVSRDKRAGPVGVVRPIAAY